MVPLRNQSLTGRVSVGSPLSVLLAVSLVLVSKRPATAEEAALTLLPVTTQLRACDPLFIKVLIRNPHEQPIRYDIPMGTLRFEIRYPGTSDYRKVNARSQSAAGVGVTFPRRHALPPGKAVVKDETLFLSGKTPLFASAGLHEVRVRITHNGGIEGVSPAVRILVTPVSDKERQRILRDAETLYASVGETGIAPDVELETLVTLRNELTPSLLGNTLYGSSRS